MNSFVKTMAIVFAVAISCNLNAQYNKQYLEANKSYSRGKIYIKKTIQPIEARNIMFVQDSLVQYTDAGSGGAGSMTLASGTVNYVKVKTGSKAGAFALYGGGLMGLSALVGVLTAEGEAVGDYGETSGINWTPFVLGFTAGGALVGAAIGAFVPKYTNYYVKTPGMAVNVKIVPQYYYGRAAGVGVRVTF
ncbi:MAG: hypothetical protein GT597_14815 [Bacteroidales bacterium]|jgi:hypothetical protein|nr:hypothetical protein [Bacteroidales bacterium]HNX66246.1 hypothetical protein [Bacteroidales bacterium]